MPAAGARTWYIPDAYLPSTGRGETYESHEAVCLLNVGDRDATVELACYYADREPITGIRIALAARRCLHVRLDQPAMLGGVELARDVPYGIALVADHPIVVQYSRLDVTQPNYSLMTTIPHPGSG